MSSRQEDLVVMLDAPELGPSRPVGVLTRWPGHVLSVGFQYAASWLRSDDSFPIDPSLPLVEYLTTIGRRRLPGIFSDSAPDAWGELLLRRRAGRELDAWGYLVEVADTTRMGALRLRRGVDGPFESGEDAAVPPLSRLRELQEAARRFQEDPDAEMDESLAQLLAAGSSLGGARPKANYQDPSGHLWIAKFPARTDRRDVGAWEHVYARLAEAAGIDVPETDLLSIGSGARTFVTRRFDRTSDGRRLYASAQTLSGHASISGADYVDFARAIRESVAADAVRDDLAQLYRRMVFNVVAANRDDHSRNHGFLRTKAGWRLAPAFDMNPAREMREHATAVDGRASDISVDHLLAVRSHFGLAGDAARRIVDEVIEVLGTWRGVAHDTGISRAEQDRVGSVITLPARTGPRRG
ncbi:MAG: type II toxin-antitoxin system HipA family toxin [Chloroflexota bacterium]